VPQPREERQGRNEALLREVNEAIERGQWPSSADDPVRFRCECALLDCNETIEMTVGEYERLRQDPRRFVLLPGHEVSDVEIVVDAHGAYIIVEKQNGAGEIADDLDPRQR
jgi:hypothetical protein